MIKIYKEKSNNVEVIKYTGKNSDEIYDWIYPKYDPSEAKTARQDIARDLGCVKGDYVVKEGREVFKVRSDIFPRTYKEIK